MTAIIHTPIFAPAVLNLIKQTAASLFSKPAAIQVKAQAVPMLPINETVAISYKRQLKQAVLAVNFLLDDGADFDHTLAVISDRYSVCPEKLRLTFKTYWDEKTLIKDKNNV